jgi:hypothetical protein
MRWKIVSRVAKRTHEQFRVEVYLRVGVQTRRARFTPHRFVRDNLRRAKEREREKERKKEKKHVRLPASLVEERTKEKQAASPASPDSPLLVKRIIDRESVPFKDGSKSQIDVALIDARFPANLLAKRRHHHRTTKAKFVVIIVVIIIIIIVVRRRYATCHQNAPVRLGSVSAASPGHPTAGCISAPIGDRPANS